MTQPKATNRHGVKPQTEDGSVREHVLLTVLGTDPQPACYVLDDLQAEATMAPIALVELLPEEECPDRVLALCTPEARRDSLPLLEQSLAARCPAEAVDVPRGETQEETSAFVTTLARCVPKDVDLTVDVTHGYRHFAFLMYVAVLYLAPLRGVRIRRACYGMLNRMPEPSPFLDLGPLLDLPRWVHALKVLDETGSALPLARLLDSGSASGPAKTIARDLGRLSEAYLSGLPLELGRQAQIVRQCHPKPLRKLLRNAHRVPLADDLVGRLDEILRGFDPAGSLPSGPGWKGNVAASKGELRRQARVIDDLLQRELFATALGLMNEWTVSWVAWVRGKGEEWLDYRKVRTSAAALLGAMCAAQKSELRHLLTEDLCRLGSFWGQLGELRNGYAHHGMRPQVLVGDTETDKKRRRIITYWEGTLRSLPNFSLLDLPRGRILVSPIGLRPGVLFSALQAFRVAADGRDPASCLVICSRETEVMIAEALRQAGYGGDFEPLVVEDPLGGGAGEIERLGTAARAHLFGATEVCVNVTGGTTLMGLIAEQLATEARKLASPVRRFGLIDRRPPDEQLADPYLAGEPFWLDPGEAGNVS